MAGSASSLQTLLLKWSATFDNSAPVSLALQIAHTLRYQHDWTDLRLHIGSGESVSSKDPTIEPLLSGVPPQRLYVHPDEQIHLLQKQKEAGKTGLPEMQSEREWVLPTHLRDKWSLQRFAQVFDTIDLVPDASAGVVIPFDESDGDSSVSIDSNVTNPWRKTKRVALATLDDDSTVVFYIMHDGIVKPRQN